MKKIAFLVLISSFTFGCAAPRYTGEPLTLNPNEDIEVVIVEDSKTRAGFIEVVEDWLSKNAYKYEVVRDRTKHDHSKITIEYVGYWSWDLALYLRKARIEAFNQGQRVGEVEFFAPNTLNTNKFGNAEERINLMMDILFGKITDYEATKMINDNGGKKSRLTKPSGGH